LLWRCWPVGRLAENSDAPERPLSDADPAYPILISVRRGAGFSCIEQPIFISRFNQLRQFKSFTQK
jgi:hypothetical protein